MTHAAIAYARWQAATEAAERACSARWTEGSAEWYAHLATRLRALLLDEMITSEARAISPPVYPGD